MGWWCRQGLWRKKRGISFLGLLFCCHCCSGGRNRRFETHFLTLKPAVRGVGVLGFCGVYLLGETVGMQG
ncbi:hypothetical protein CCHOA_05390 [Corynebacterium choanae]|uniref:Uncharacterized protein n=1 Tax=Corynebacterium choanae TaxID=1862358 RepID=A0A3G6J6B6_9CORY|nr:hypothetical protein CCHOA_05390 [Corynebacterium choanae]